MKTRRPSTSLLTRIAATLAVLAGCAGYLTPQDKLRHSVTTFNEDVRWQRFQAAALHVPSPNRHKWLRAMERAGRHLRILEYELRPVVVGDEEATIDVAITYMTTSDQRVVQTVRRQHWSRVEGGWHLTREAEAPAVDGPPPAGLPDFTADGTPAAALDATAAQLPR